MPDSPPLEPVGGGKLARAAGLTIFATLTLGLVVPDVISAGYTLLCLLGVVWLVRTGQWRRPGLSHTETWLILAVVLYVAAWLLGWVVHGLAEAGISGAQRLPKLLMLVPIFLFLRHIRGLEAYWWNGLMAGAVMAGSYALWFYLSGQTGAYEQRVEGPTNPIYFGGIALAFALMLVPRVADDEQPVPMRTLAALAIVMAFIANALSGSRGAWLAIPVMLLVYVLTVGRLQPPAWRLGVPAAVLALSLVILLAPTLPMNARLAETFLELELLGGGQYSNGGIGLRLQMWQIAWSVFTEHPLGGAGPEAFRQALEQAVAAGAFGPALLRYYHPHSEYLSALTMLGLPGLLLLLLLFITPALAIARYARSELRQRRFLAWCGSVSVAVLTVMALSESIFERNGGVVWFGLLIAMTAGLAHSAGDRSRAP